MSGLAANAGASMDDLRNGGHVAFVGAGAIGCYVGGRMALAGIDVTLIDPWGEHVDTIRRDGVTLSGTQGEANVRVHALHVHEVQRLIEKPIDVAFVTVKSYDTEWSTLLVRDYLATSGFAVSLQNGINEERIARHLGWGRTLGCIASTIGVSLVGPGHAVRHYQPGGASYTIFRVGEVHGRITPRARAVAAMLRTVDSSEVTSDLWGERWAKVTANSMHNGLAAITGLTHLGIYSRREPRRVAIHLGAEAARVGRALGYNVAAIRDIPVDMLEEAARGDEQAFAATEERMQGWTVRMTEEGRPSTAQDVIKGRRTEIDAINGLVVESARDARIDVPYQRALLDLVKRVERRTLAAGPENLELLQRSAAP
jgi:2-dehydropantoate 2-reductase